MKNDHTRFQWVELAAGLCAGGMVRKHWIPADDPIAVASWREKFHNRDVYASICRFEKPSHDSSYVCPFFLDIDSEDDLPTARTETLKACSLLSERMGIGSESLDIHFSGAKGFHVIVPLVVFGSTTYANSLAIWRELAKRLAKEGLSHIDLGVYQASRLLRLPNSINSKSRLHKVPLEYKELRDFGLDYALQLARSPREENSMAVPEECPEAAAWLAKAVRWQQAKRGRTPNRPSKAGRLKRGWRVPPCIRNLEAATLPDGVRHDAYFVLARFYGWINMHALEAEERIGRIDQRHPIRDPDYIHRVAESGRRYVGFPGCGNRILRKFCGQAECFVKRQSPPPGPMDTKANARYIKRR